MKDTPPVFIIVNIILAAAGNGNSFSAVSPGLDRISHLPLVKIGEMV